VYVITFSLDEVGAQAYPYITTLNESPSGTIANVPLWMIGRCYISRRFHHVLNQALEFFIRLRPHRQVTAGEKRRYGIDTVGGAPTPIFIDGVFVGPA
jgi:hypothetical protein